MTASISPLRTWSPTAETSVTARIWEHACHLFLIESDPAVKRQLIGHFMYVYGVHRYYVCKLSVRKVPGWFLELLFVRHKHLVAQGRGRR